MTKHLNVNIRYIFISIILSLIMVAMMPLKCYAASGVIGGSTGNGSSAGGPYDESCFISWSYASADGNFDISNPPNQYLTYEWPAGGTSDWNPTQYGPWGNPETGEAFSGSGWDGYGNNTYWAATVVRELVAGNSRWGACRAVKAGNFPQYSSSWGENLPSFFYDNRDKCGEGFYSGASGAWMADNAYYKLNNTGQMMFACYIDTYKLYITKTFNKNRTVITKTTNTGEDFDDTIKTTTENGRKELYVGGATSGVYYDTTPPTGEQSHNYSKEVKINITVITKSVTLTTLTKDMPTTFEEAEYLAEHPDDRIKTNEDGSKAVVIEYIASPGPSGNKTITYKADLPDNPQVKFRPFNLNRNNYVETGDGGIYSDYTNNAKYNIFCSLNNKQNIIDNSHLNSLDINNDTIFEFTFKNNQFGMPAYDFLTSPTPLKEGTWEYSGQNYANGRVGDTTDIDINKEYAGIYRYDLEFDASITGNDIHNVSSLGKIENGNYEENLEATSDQSLIWKANKNTFNFKGGDWYSRFILNGVYNTDNSYEFNDFKKNYWMVKYKQDRFYEYGMSYKGSYNVIQSSNYEGVGTLIINDPNLTSPTVAPNIIKTSSSSFYSNGTTHRGLYVGSSQKTYYQPVLYGHWNVKTLAGDTN